MPVGIGSSNGIGQNPAWFRPYRPHTVEPGETLASIAEDYGVSRQELINLNHDIWDPDNVPAGFILRIPADVINDDAATTPSNNTGRTSTGGAGRPTVIDGVQVPAFPRLARYEPNSDEAVKLFTAAAVYAGLPTSWASAPGLHHIMRKESDGWVGRPNYTYGRRSRQHSSWPAVHEELRRGRKTARSSATGIGQLLLSNVDAYYPSGRQGIGDPFEEAVGMLRYIKNRYGDPANAWARYGVNHEGY